MLRDPGLGVPTGRVGEGAAGVETGVPIALGVGDVPIEVPTGVLVGTAAAVPTGVSVGVGGRGMGGASNPLAVLGLMGAGGKGEGMEGLVAGEEEGVLEGLPGAGLGAPGQR